MKYFFDTSVLVSVAILRDARHAASLAAYVKADLTNACCSLHSLAETYAVLTRLPGNQRMAGDQALVFLDDIRSRLRLVALNPEQYYDAIKSAAAEGIYGGTIYDMLIATCALSVGASVIYTWDVGDFSRLGAEVAKRVRTP